MRRQNIYCLVGYPWSEPAPRWAEASIKFDQLPPHKLNLPDALPESLSAEETIRFQELAAKNATELQATNFRIHCPCHPGRSDSVVLGAEDEPNSDEYNKQRLRFLPVYIAVGAKPKPMQRGITNLNGLAVSSAPGGGPGAGSALAVPAKKVDVVHFVSPGSVTMRYFELDSYWRPVVDEVAVVGNHFDRLSKWYCVWNRKGDLVTRYTIPAMATNYTAVRCEIPVGQKTQPWAVFDTNASFVLQLNVFSTHYAVPMTAGYGSGKADLDAGYHAESMRNLVRPPLDIHFIGASKNKYVLSSPNRAHFGVDLATGIDKRRPLADDISGPRVMSYRAKSSRFAFFASSSSSQNG